MMPVRRALLLSVTALTAACSGGGDGTDAQTGDDVFFIPDGSPQADVPKVQSAIGGICQGDDDCLSGYCNTFPQGGYCTQYCGDDLPPCPDESQVCTHNIDSDRERRRMCLKSCIATTQCRLDQWCPPEAGLCVPRCQPGDCGGDLECNATGQCVPAAPCQPTAEVCDGLDQDCNALIDEGCGPLNSSPDYTRLVDLGRVSVGGGGVSRSLVFTPSTDATSFTIIALAEDEAEVYMDTFSIRAPDGTNLLAPGPYESVLNESAPSVGIFTVQVPNSDQVDLLAGAYQFNLFRYAIDADTPSPVGHVHVYVIENLRDDPTASTLDLNLWFVGIPGLDAASAPNHTRFQSLMGRFGRVLSSLGITLGDIRYFDVTGPDAQRFTIVDTGSAGQIDEHAELLTLTASLPADNRGMNLFFVQGFTGWQLLGKAGGIPGPPGMNGTYQSGVVVSLADFLQPGELGEDIVERLTAETMTHELGHQLGLYHTTESDGRSFDHLLDTAPCPAEMFDTNGDGLVDPLECASQDALNLMFWTVSLEVKLTHGQRKAVHRNPAMRD